MAAALQPIANPPSHDVAVMAPSAVRHREDREFLAPVLEILETPPSPVRVAMIWVICSLAIVTLMWAYVGRIDIIAVAQGKVQPVGRVKVIEPIVSGRVASIEVSNGSHVEAGDVLVQLDQSEAEADVMDAKVTVDSLRAELLRRTEAMEAATRGEFSGTKIGWPDDMPTPLRHREDGVLAAEMSGLRATLAELQAQKSQKASEVETLKDTILTQKRLVSTLQSRVDIKTQLADQKIGTKTAVLDATETLQHQQTQLAIQGGQLASDEAAISVVARQLEKTVSAFVSDNAEKLTEIERSLADYRQRLAKAKARADQTTLRAPISGQVQALAVHSLGQVVTTGQQMLRIVPDNADPEIEVYVLNRDIGFVKLGAEAIVKIDSFPFTRYGTLNAKVISVAADAIPLPDVIQNEGNPASAGQGQEYAGGQRTQNLVFPVILKPDQSYILVDGERIRLSAGMSATIEIKTGDRRFLEYIFSPLVGTASEALRER